MFDMAKIILKLEACHTMYRIAIDGVTVMDNGWLVRFECFGRESTGMEGCKYQRVAFFEPNKGPDPSIKWDCIC